MKQLPMDTLTAIELPDGDISIEGMEQIQALLVRHFGDQHGLPDFFRWQWAVRADTFPKGEQFYNHLTGRMMRRPQLVGTLPKRVAKYYADCLGKYVDETILGELGNIAKRHCTEGGKVHVDFTRNWDWLRGTFSDGTSCFYSQKPYAMATMSPQGCFAIRTWIPLHGDERLPEPVKSYWRSYPGFRPFGRAWAYRLPKLGYSFEGHVWEDDEVFIVFNGYQKDRDTLFFARLLALYLDKSYGKIEIRDGANTWGGDVYLNYGRGFLVASARTLRAVQGKKLILGWPTIQEEWYTKRCGACNNPYGHFLDNNIVEEGASYHASCTVECTECGRLISSSIQPRGTEMKLCPSCGEGLVETCRHCGEVWLRTQMLTPGHGQGGYCPDCLANGQVGRCVCGRYTRTELLAEEKFCRVCLQKPKGDEYCKETGQKRPTVPTILFHEAAGLSEYPDFIPPNPSGAMTAGLWRWHTGFRMWLPRDGCREATAAEIREHRLREEEDRKREELFEQERRAIHRKIREELRAARTVKKEPPRIEADVRFVDEEEALKKAGDVIEVAATAAAAAGDLTFAEMLQRAGRVMARPHVAPTPPSLPLPPIPPEPGFVWHWDEVWGHWIQRHETTHAFHAAPAAEEPIPQEEQP